MVIIMILTTLESQGTTVRDTTMKNDTKSLGATILLLPQKIHKSSPSFIFTETSFGSERKDKLGRTIELMTGVLSG